MNPDTRYHSPVSWAELLVTDEWSWVTEQLGHGLRGTVLIAEALKGCVITDWAEPAWLGRLAVACESQVRDLVAVEWADS